MDNSSSGFDANREKADERLPRKFRLCFGPKMNTASILRWAVHGYKVPKDRQDLLHIFTSRWPASDRTPTEHDFDRLLNGEINWTDDDGIVVFTV
jgi:hypothetical protein